MALTEVNSLGIKDLEVKTGDIAADAVTGAKIADDAIDSEHYVNASIDHAHLADDCVDGDNIADNSVGLAAMAHGTDGNLITFDASGAPAYVATGNDGQVLTSTGAGSPPAFETISAAPPAFRNYIINGEALVNQRRDSTGKTSTGFYGPDRWQTKIEGSCGTWSISQDAGPADKGHAKSILWHCTSGATPSGTDEIYTRYRIEAQNLQDTKWGTSDAVDLILSFWVKSTETGTGIIQVYHNDHSTSDAHTGYSYSISSASTWEKKTIQLVKSTSDAFGFDEGVGMSIQIYFDGGSDMKSGSLNTSYAAHNNANIMPGQTIALAGTGKKLWLTGVQLEKGTTATDFEHRTFADELAKCQRYYWRVTGNANDMPGWSHHMWHASASHAHFTCPVPMRNQPSFTQNCTAKIVSGDASDTWTSGMYIDNACTNHDNGGGFTAGTFRKDIAGSSIDHPGTTQITVAGNFEFSSEL